MVFGSGVGIIGDFKVSISIKIPLQEAASCPRDILDFRSRLGRPYAVNLLEPTFLGLNLVTDELWIYG